MAQPTGFSPGPCGLGPKKPTLKKAPNKEVHRAKNHTKAMWVRANPGAFIFHTKNILLFKIYYYLWDRPNEPNKHDDLNRSNDPDLPDDLDKNDDSNRHDDPNRPNDPNGPDDPDEPDRNVGRVRVVWLVRVVGLVQVVGPVLMIELVWVVGPV